MKSDISEGPLILIADDDQVILQLIEKILSDSGYSVATADNGRNALLALNKAKPELILLDVMMPEMNGYEVCSRLQENQETAYIPVIFVTALGDEQNKAKAFSAGGADYLVKPVNRDTLLKTVAIHLKTKSRWNKFKKEISTWDIAQPLNFTKFKDSLAKKIDLPPARREELSQIKVSELYSRANNFNLNAAELTRYIAEFSGMNYLPNINPESVQLGKMPKLFCKKNNLIPIKDESGKNIFVISNPFDWELLDLLGSYFKNQPYDLALADPNTITSLFIDESLEKEEAPSIKDREEIEKPGIEPAASLSEQESAEHPIISVANNMLESAVNERASDIHVEPKEGNTVVRFRIDGNVKEMFTIKKEKGIRLISRFKVLADMDIAEKRKPQDGALAAIIDNKTYNLRLATLSTIYGESLIIRLLAAYAKAKELQELGMTDEQSNTLIHLANRNQGLILVVGPTGSGKTTTIYSLLHKIDYNNRSIVSVEDPVEYRIPFINQEQVREKGKVTFEALLKSVVRQDPDVLFLGEVRDNYSATTAMNFASTGHLTISSLHTSNTTTAIFRLERLGIDRRTMADSFIGIIAQRLLKKLCPHCKETVPISEEERKMLLPFTSEIPLKVAHPAGCSKCNNTGYYGREGIYEILDFDREISEAVRSNITISDIRSLARKRGDHLISHHALEKVKKLIFPPKDVYENVLVEETGFQKVTPEIIAPKAQPPGKKREDKRRILVAEDDKVPRALITRLLENSGYTVTIAEDGIDALLHMGETQYDLILSDINMPNLDGFKLLEMKNQKGIETPVIFITGSSSSEDKKRGFELGAADYIKKPIEKEALLLSVKNVIEKQKKEQDKND
ncbi:MAG TPA: response regulator [Candidatus Aminicenantes bacterium]|nr:response regulator [Candidatus Aminicenantes bacterium]